MFVSRVRREMKIPEKFSMRHCVEYFSKVHVVECTLSFYRVHIDTFDKNGKRDTIAQRE